MILKILSVTRLPKAKIERPKTRLIQQLRTTKATGAIDSWGKWPTAQTLVQESNFPAKTAVP